MSDLVAVAILVGMVVVARAVRRSIHRTARPPVVRREWIPEQTEWGPLPPHKYPVLRKTGEAEIRLTGRAGDYPELTPNHVHGDGV